MTQTTCYCDHSDTLSSRHGTLRVTEARLAPSPCDVTLVLKSLRQSLDEKNYRSIKKESVSLFTFFSFTNPLGNDRKEKKIFQILTYIYINTTNIYKHMPMIKQNEEDW